MPTLRKISGSIHNGKYRQDRGNFPHAGSAWKLINSKGRRVGTISKDGIFLQD